MYSLKVENAYGEVLELTGNKNYNITDIEGLTPQKADINTSEVAGVDGSVYNSARIGNRNIVITIVPEFPCDKNRVNIYNYFMLKSKCRIYYKNRIRDVYIDGYVEAVEGNPFSQKQEIQVSIICTNPYFIDEAETIEEESIKIGLFQFPTSLPKEGDAMTEVIEPGNLEIMNIGDVETGLIIELMAKGSIEEPVVQNKLTKEYIKVNCEMKEGDVLVINTIKKQKSIILKRDGKELNMINYISENSKWLQMRRGKNEFSYNCKSGMNSISIKIRHTNLYVGV